MTNANDKSIQRFIEIPLYELQTEKAKNMDISLTHCCCICGKLIKENAKYKTVHILNNGNIVSYSGSDVAESMGFFPVGMECAKKLTIQFAF